MSFLARFSIMTKILTIIVVMAFVAGSMSWLGINALGSLNTGAGIMSAAAKRALTGARANQNVLTLSRSEFRAALDPRPENRAAVRKVVEEQIKMLEERIDDLNQTPDEKAKALMPAIKDAWISYQKSMEETLGLADRVKDVQLNEEVIKLRESAMKGRADAEKLQASIRAVSDRLVERLESYAKAADEEYHSTSRLLIIMAVVGTLLGVIGGFIIGQYGVVKPIRLIVALLGSLAKGDFSVVVTGIDRKDEIGDIAKAAVAFKENGMAKVRMQEEQAATELERAAQRKADMLKLANDFEGAVSEIIQTVSSAATELEVSANMLTSTATRTEELSTVVAAAAEEASTNVQSVAAASEEMSSSVNEISRQVQESSRIAGDAVAQAEATNARVGELSETAKKIGDVVRLISNIAAQTNLLALNATIEAARAGDAGRGFAVVASEVKALAEQTAKATGEIGEQIAAIQIATEGSVVAIREIGITISRISEISSTIAAAVEEQGAATQEISRNVQQAAQGTTEVAANICDVQRGSTETGSASSQVLSSAQSLSVESNRLKSEVQNFLATVRAA